MNGNLQQWSQAADAIAADDAQQDAAINATMGIPSAPPADVPAAPHPFVAPTGNQMLALYSGQAAPPPAATPQQQSQHIQALVAANQAADAARGGAAPIVDQNAAPPGKPSVWDDPTGMQAALARGDANPSVTKPSPFQQQARAADQIVGYSKPRAGVGAPSSTPMPGAAGALANYARGGYGMGGAGGGFSFDPYKNEKAAALAGKGVLSAEQKALEGPAADRVSAIAGAGDENKSYAAKVAADNAAEEKERARLDDERKTLIDSEASRDYTKEYFKRGGIVAGLAGFIGAIAGGALQGFRGLPNNPFLEQQNKDIDRYIASAQHNATLKIGEQNNLYTHFLDATKSKDAATALTHETLLNGYRNQLEKAGAETDDVQTRGHFADAAQSIDMQIAQWNDASAVAMQKARVAAAGANNPFTLAKEELDLRKTQAEIGKINAETGKTQAEAATGPKLSDEQKAQREADAAVAPLDEASRNVDQLTRGTQLGGAVSAHLPQWVPGVKDAQAAVNDRESFNNRVKASIAGAYKLSTNANEPKNLALIESYARPYEITSKDSPEIAAQKIGSLRTFVADSARAQGATVAPKGSALSSYAQPAIPGLTRVPGT